MSPYAYHALALATMQRVLGPDCPVVGWNDKPDWQIIPGSAKRRQDLADGGFQLNADFLFEALVSTFAGALTAAGPVVTATDLKGALLNTAIVYLGDKYKAVAVHIRPGGLQVGVHCNGFDQGA